MFDGCVVRDPERDYLAIAENDLYHRSEVGSPS
jgi:hypothetical protein